MFDSQIAASKLKAIRMDLGLSLQEMAELIGFKSKASVAQLETGKICISCDKLYIISLKLGIATGWLLGLEQEKYTESSLIAAENELRNSILRLTLPSERLNFTGNLLEYLNTANELAVAQNDRADIIYLIHVGYMPILSCLAAAGLSPESVPDDYRRQLSDSGYVLSNRATQECFSKLHKAIRKTMDLSRTKKECTAMKEKDSTMEQKTNFALISLIFKDDIGEVYPSIYKGYALALGYTEKPGQKKIVLIPEETLGFKDDRLYLKGDATSGLHELGFFSEQDNTPEQASIDDHVHCNPYLFMDGVPLPYKPFKAELCNFGYQLERLRADGLTLKTDTTKKIAVENAGSYCFLDDTGKINYYVSKEVSVYDGYSLARAVHYEAGVNIVTTASTYMLVENVPGGSQRPLNVTPFGFIFSRRFICEEAHRQEYYTRLKLNDDDISALKDLFIALDESLVLTLKEESKVYIEKYLGFR